MKLRFDLNQLTVGDMMGIETGSIRAIHDVVIRFAVDENGEPMDPAEASETLRAMTIPELNEWAEHIQVAVQEAAVPPETARSSKRGSKSGGQRRSG